MSCRNLPLVHTYHRHQAVQMNKTWRWSMWHPEPFGYLFYMSPLLLLGPSYVDIEGRACCRNAIQIHGNHLGNATDNIFLFWPIPEIQEQFFRASCRCPRS